MALISHRYKFIFIKTKKTAGTATEVTLSSLMGADDIVTPIYPLEPGHEARNYEVPNGKFYNHMPAREIRELLGAKTFESYFKFCVEREPLDKCMSHYAMLKYSPHHNQDNSDLDWARYVDHGGFPVDLMAYMDNDGSPLVDHIINYETLSEELSKICAERGLPFSELTSNAKSGFRKQGPRVEDITADQRLKINSAFHKNSTFLKTHFNSNNSFTNWG